MIIPHIFIPPRRTLMARNDNIDNMSAGLESVRGAQSVIELLSPPNCVTRIVLGHNNLGNEGVELLFKFLQSSAGRRHHINEISLNSNGIGDRGLIAIAAYLHNNSTLKELYLQDNRFTGNSSTGALLAKAINKSRLELIALSSNTMMSDTFARSLFLSLDSRFLRELHLSAIGLTHRSARPIASFIASPCCRLNTLKVSGNHLGFRGVKCIVRAIEKSNYGLTSVEIRANHISTPPTDSDDNDSGDEANSQDELAANVDLWKVTDAYVRRVLARNAYLKRETHKAATTLLCYSRTLLLRKGSSASIFHSLPVELQLYILAFLAPTLSDGQRVRIFTHSSFMSTLPTCLSRYDLPRLRSSLMSEGRSGWLEAVGCAVFDPGPPRATDGGARVY